MKLLDQIVLIAFYAFAAVALTSILFTHAPQAPAKVLSPPSKESVAHHDLGETSTAQGSSPCAEGGRILIRGASKHHAEPSGSVAASQNNHVCRCPKCAKWLTESAERTFDRRLDERFGKAKLSPLPRPVGGKTK